MLQSVKISELPSVDTLTEDDLIVIDQPDDTKKATLFQVLNHLEDSVEQSTLGVLAQPDGYSKVGSLEYLFNKGNIVRISPYKLIYTNDNEAFSAALHESKDESGYTSKIIINDTGKPLQLTQRFAIQSSASTSVLGDSYNDKL